MSLFDFIATFVQNQPRQYLVSHFMTEFHVPVPNDVRLSYSLQNEAVRKYQLMFPRWAYSRKDGRRNRQHRDNTLVFPTSCLILAGWKIECNNPFVMNRFVIELRRAGYGVPLCSAEEEKKAAICQAVSTEFRGTSAAQLYAKFRKDSTGFEEWCATLFRRMGVQVRVTPASNDGGYDLDILNKGIRTLAECKCYHPTKGTVGRPALQKLVGANATEHAPYLLFMTTGRYSAPAVAYAREQHIELWDGPELIRRDRMLTPFRPTPQDIPFDKWFLTDRDILTYCPPDYQDNPIRRQQYAG